MSRCFLGGKKLKRIEAIVGKKVISASVRGGNAHYWASVAVEGEGKSWLVNYKTGRIVVDADFAKSEVQKAFDAAWSTGKSELEAQAAADAKYQEIWG